MACDHRWGGLQTSHCAACHETFASLSAFDRHQRWRYGSGDAELTCLAPDTTTDSKGRRVFHAKAGTGYWAVAQHKEAPQWRS